MKYLLITLLFMYSLQATADIYEHSTSSGTSYSDTPASNAQPVTIPALNNSISLPQGTATSPATDSQTLSSPSVVESPASPSASGEPTKALPYTSFTMISPTDQQTFQNQRDIPIKLSLSPSLQEGDKIRLFLDGNPAGEATAGNLNGLVLHQVDRGEHRLSATLLDKEGHILKQIDAVTIYVHYSAIPTGSGAVKANPASSPASP